MLEEVTTEEYGNDVSAWMENAHVSWGFMNRASKRKYKDGGGEEGNNTHTPTHTGPLKAVAYSLVRHKRVHKVPEHQ